MNKEIWRRLPKVVKFADNLVIAIDEAESAAVDVGDESKHPASERKFAAGKKVLCAYVAAHQVEPFTVARIDHAHFTVLTLTADDHLLHHCWREDETIRAEKNPVHGLFTWISFPVFSR